MFLAYFLHQFMIHIHKPNDLSQSVSFHLIKTATVQKHHPGLSMSSIPDLKKYYVSYQKKLCFTSENTKSNPVSTNFSRSVVPSLPHNDTSLFNAKTLFNKRQSLRQKRSICLFVVGTRKAEVLNNLITKITAKENDISLPKWPVKLRCLFVNVNYAVVSPFV